MLAPLCIAAVSLGQVFTLDPNGNGADFADLQVAANTAGAASFRGRRQVSKRRAAHGHRGGQSTGIRRSARLGPCATDTLLAARILIGSPEEPVQAIPRSNTPGCSPAKQCAPGGDDSSRDGMNHSQQPPASSTRRRRISTAGASSRVEVRSRTTSSRADRWNRIKTST